MRDLRMAFRALMKQPGFTAVAVVTIALGVGANSAIFTVVDAVMLRALPFHDPDTVVVITERTELVPTLSVSPLNYADLCASSRSYQACGATRNTTLNISGGSEPQRVFAKMLSANVLPLLGVEPILGRGFSDAEDRAGGEPVAILSHAVWQSRFGSSPGIVGQPVLLDGSPYSIVGVLPASFRLFQAADVYVPIGPFIAEQPIDRGWHPGILPIARLKDGVSMDQARTEAAGIATRLEQAYPQTNRRVGFNVTRAQDLLVQGVRTPLLLLLGAVVAVLLIACLNVAGLLLARGLSRRRELAVRIALGAGHGRIVGHLLVESMLIAVVGGAAGLILASFAVPVLVQLVGPTLPRADSIAVDERVVAFTFGLALITGLVFGLVPALQSTQLDVRQALSEGGRGGVGAASRQRRTRTTLVIVQVALTVVLLVGAALLIRSFAVLQDVPSGFDTANALVAELPLSSATYADDATRTAAVDRLIERIRSLPGVTGAATTTQLPMAGGGATIHFNVHGAPPAGPEQFTAAGYRAISADYFSTMGIALRRGRMLTAADRHGSMPVVVVNETMARQHIRSSNPVGQRLQLGAIPDDATPWMEVVGVVADVRQAPDAEAKAEMYVPYAQHPDPVLRRLFANVTLVVKTAGPPAQLASAVRSIVREIDPDQPIANVRTLEDVTSASVTQPRFRTFLLGLFAAIALVLAGIGVYGLLAHGVAQRLNEFGVRMALGASPDAVLRLVLKEGATLSVIGIGAGLLLAALTVRVLRSVLFSISLWDPVAWIGATITLLAVALLASWIPARRAVRTDPVVALRA
jgi:putative ABC transport system permease protein